MSSNSNTQSGGGFGSFLNDIWGTFGNLGNTAVKDPSSLSPITNPVGYNRNFLGTAASGVKSVVDTGADILNPDSPAKDDTRYLGLADVPSTDGLAKWSGGGDGGGSGSGSQYADTSGARAITLDLIGSLANQLTNLNASDQSDYDELYKRYNEEDGLALGQYNTQKSSNEGTRSSNYSQALAAAAQGGRGLRSTLAALGALGGTGQTLANRAVASSANKDIGGANDTYKTNAENLNNAWATAEQDQKRRKAEADTSLENSKIKNAASIASQRQGLFKDMAAYFTQAGDNSSAQEWLAKVSGEIPAVERGSRTKTPSFTPRSAEFSPAALKNYLAGGRDLSVQTETGDGGLPINSPLYALSRKREELG